MNTFFLFTVFWIDSEHMKSRNIRVTNFYLFVIQMVDYFVCTFSWKEVVSYEIVVDHLKTVCFRHQKRLVFEWFRSLNGRLSDPHCISHELATQSYRWIPKEESHTIDLLSIQIDKYKKYSDAWYWYQASELQTGNQIGGLYIKYKKLKNFNVFYY